MSQTLPRSLVFAASVRGPSRLALAWRRLTATRHQLMMRRELAQLDDRMLSDIGISRAQASFLSEQPVLGMLGDTLR